jgi:hypothetical protein
MDEMMSGEEGSYSSRMSNKSEKNMADFDGEESGCDDELVQLAAQVQYVLVSKIVTNFKIDLFWGTMSISYSLALVVR